MRKLIFTTLIIILTISVKSQNKNISIEKYISKNFIIPDELKDNCNWNYFGVELKLNSNNKIEYKILNKTSANFMYSLKFIENYSIKSNQNKEFPALVFITIQNESGNCGDNQIKTPFAGEITAEIINIIKDEIAIFPNLKLLNPITTIVGTKHY